MSVERVTVFTLVVLPAPLAPTSVVTLPRATASDTPHTTRTRVGYAAAELMPVYLRLRELILTSGKIAVDETVAPVLDPGRGRTKKGFCNGPSVVNPSFALSDRRALASVRGRREAAT